MDLAHLLKKCHIRFSLNRPKSCHIHLKTSKQKNTKSHVQLSIDHENMFCNVRNSVLFTFNPFSPAGTTFLVEFCNPINRQAIELESCSNPLKTGEGM